MPEKRPPQLCVCVFGGRPELCNFLSHYSAIMMASEDCRMSKQGAAVRQKHVTLIPEKLEITRSRNSGKSCRIIMVACNMDCELPVT